eukprot:GGOE01041338.1.p1 GENE.GGOE01041338.1~~GGOE01041338.1.p1  ORF type:complete len:357 (-),score=82.21 GGOE01041338.1:191-1261(-)
MHGHFLSAGSRAVSLLLFLFFLCCESTILLPSHDTIRVSLYLVGHPRTLNSTLCSLLDMVVKPLLASKCHLTIFTYTARSPGTEQYDALAALPNVQVVTHLVNHLPRLPAPCVVDLNSRICLVHGAYNEELLEHFRRLEGVDLLRAAYEEMTGVRFDWVLFARPDVTFVDRLPPIHTFSPHHVHVPIWHSSGGINDRFALVPRAFSARFFRMFHALCAEGLGRRLPKQVVNPEMLYRWYLEEAHIPIAVVRNFFFVRTRMERTPFGKFHGRDLSLLDSTRCLRAFKYRHCWASTVSPRPAAGPETPLTPSDVHAVQTAKALCRKFQRSATREAAAAERFAVVLLQGQHIQRNSTAS